MLHQNKVVGNLIERMKNIPFVLTLFLLSIFKAYSQADTCTFQFQKHVIESKYLNQQREFWVSLPFGYTDTVKYKVMYVFDAEWRFNLVRNIEFDYSANRKIDKHIIVGIPHVDWEYQRGIDLTFSESRTEYDGEAVDSTWYNSSNSGGGMQFYQYLTKELIPGVEAKYSTNGHNTLIGHSYGGYFAGYIMSMDHPFSTLHLYDPSIWYSNGEVIAAIKRQIPKKGKVDVLITYQPKPVFHQKKIEALIKVLQQFKQVSLHTQLYEHETHNGLYLPSFLKGIELEMAKKALPKQ